MTFYAEESPFKERHHLTQRELTTEFKDFAAKAEVALRFVLSSSRWLGDGATFDIDYDSSCDRLSVTSRFTPEAFAPALRWRFDFWCAHSGGKSVARSAVQKAAHGKTRDDGVNLRGLSAKALPAGLKQVATRVGAPAAAPLTELVFDARLDGDGAAIVKAIDESSLTLFVPASHAPAVGDKLPMRLTLAGGESFCFEAEITSAVRQPAAKDKLGFTAALRNPQAELVSKLQRKRAVAAVALKLEQRAHRRVAVVAPVAVRVQETRGTTSSLPSRPAPAPARVRVEYATEAEFSADYLANLSKGGAFIRTRNPLPVDTAVVLDLSLPRGFSCSTRATVVHVGGGGMGVQFALDENAEGVIDAVLLHIAAPPKRALIIGTQESVVQGVTTALSGRGYVVLAAPDVDVALQLLVDEPFDVEILVAELKTPSTRLERFIDTIRYGGAIDLAITIVSDRDMDDGSWAAEHTVDLVMPAANDASSIAAGAIDAAARRRIASSAVRTDHVPQR